MGGGNGGQRGRGKAFKAGRQAGQAKIKVSRIGTCFFLGACGRRDGLFSEAGFSFSLCVCFPCVCVFSLSSYFSATLFFFFLVFFFFFSFLLPLSSYYYGRSKGGQGVF
ncbi:uncharacterized protein K452DRAFT_102228 [Aplosporella prunicola CBS 121167]|uniref:Uncharacterized protein n=1 Tax=Aplosporella prunicola CBS 121167 TaxID=1176127 RepID=A0A6A6B0J6_9PEZI|nr:uncharacterized protein K452DRAFT_102228 [Aplosporella prunicola CBS 121167]KAF2137550.1 hypothetical protein K452DRAFT_102228 [Aplosporella prunicola CBS 121167]